MMPSLLLCNDKYEYAHPSIKNDANVLLSVMVPTY